ncbi:hypothetical protein Nepgr_009468 [Nepenthes gracilis]|uniref:Uncharacterized protein n=1 Tax=Nepenthes gracilis TaxID=150966 RepID=A0AAD3SAK7_NEPGR|nr:hypothetical protein Nepgr_009468 [Nepenthes gracilis]
MASTAHYDPSAEDDPAYELWARLINKRGLSLHSRPIAPSLKQEPRVCMCPRDIDHISSLWDHWEINIGKIWGIALLRDHRVELQLSSFSKNYMDAKITYYGGNFLKITGIKLSLVQVGEARCGVFFVGLLLMKFSAGKRPLAVHCGHGISCKLIRIFLMNVSYEKSKWGIMFHADVQDTAE